MGSLFSSVPDLPRWPGHRGLAALVFSPSPAPQALLGGGLPQQGMRVSALQTAIPTAPQPHPDPCLQMWAQLYF